MIDDEPVMRAGIIRYLEMEGYPVLGAPDAEEGLRLLAESPAHLLVTGIRLRGMSGLDLIDALEARGQSVPVLVTAALPSVEQAVLALKRGAQDYLPQPLDLDRLMARLEDLWAGLRGREEARLAEVGGQSLVGSSAPMRRMVESIRTAAQSSATVLVQGETGTGKELIAKLLHEWSPRRQHTFVPLHCSALAEGVLESELFGHEKGAFTGAVRRREGRFERADSGTLFMDEIGEISPSVQVKLLRVLESGTFERVGGSQTVEVDVRLVSATHRDLETEVEAGRFREDLFYRLNVITVRIPPLRERREDIPLLARSFLAKYAEKYQKRLVGFTSEALEALSHGPWPGNVRELESTVERAVVYARGHRLERSALPRHLRAAGPSRGVVTIPVGTPLKQAEKTLVLRTLASCDNNRSRAARLLGISDRKIRYKLKEWSTE